MSYFIEKIENLISGYVSQIIKELLQSGYLISLIFKKEIQEKIKKIIFSFISDINLTNNNSENYIDDYLLELKIPGSKLLFYKFYSLLEICKYDYLKKEGEYRKKKKDEKDKVKEITVEDILHEKKHYLKSRLWNEDLLTENIFNDYNKEIIEDFLYLF